MKQTLHQLTVTALVMLLFSLPDPLLAQERRGADLVITRKAGQPVRGELIAVKPDSIVLLGLDGKDESVDVADISTIQIVRRSKAWQGLLYGFVLSAGWGAAWGYAEYENTMPESGTVIGGVFFGLTGGLVGLAAGWGAGLDSKINLAGLPEAETNRILAKLSRRARETMPAFLPHRRPRFKLTWIPGFRIFQKVFFWVEENPTFRFIGDLPPEEVGPFSESCTFWHARPAFSFRRATLAYEWTRQLSSEIEIHATGYRTDGYAGGRFTSTLDGKMYYGYLDNNEHVRATSVLLGLSYRPLPPAFLKHRVLELGVAAGWAWLGTGLYEWNQNQLEDLTEVDRKVTLTARARVSYDHYFNPAFSLGVFAEYRWLRADIPSYTVTGSVDFHEWTDTDGDVLTRTTEMTIPGKAITLGGLACGMRFGFSF